MNRRANDSEFLPAGYCRMVWPFWLELIFAALIPLDFLLSASRINTMNYSIFWYSLMHIWSWVSVVLILARIPVGIVGFCAAKRMMKLRIAARVLAVVNLCYVVFRAVLFALSIYF